MKRFAAMMIGLFLAIPTYTKADKLDAVPIHNHFVECYPGSPRKAENMRVDDFFDILDFLSKDDPIESTIKWEKVNDSLYKIYEYETNLMSGKKSVEVYGFRVNADTATLVYYNAGKGDVPQESVSVLCYQIFTKLSFFTTQNTSGFKRRNLPTK